ncbi:carph-isopro domain-containing protein [Parasedimentitalea psychrophila]|uniref:carph-isopro domain-containing protein n=1 Tax=Parasedimentitalea psychrophila TaxID=2997337 RepID=UPI0036F216E6
MTTRNLIQTLGGYRAVATRLNKKPTTVHTHMQEGTIPASWYDALCRMAREKGIEEPPRSMFSFLQVAPDGEKGRDAA